MAKFTYDDIVRIRKDSPGLLRPGERAWIIAVFEDKNARPGNAFDAFPEGTVYTIEFEDGTTEEIHESSLEYDNMI